MKSKIVLPIFGLVAVLQLAVPGSMIARRELTLREGETVLFRTAPVDPYDAFRGRYVALRVDAGEARNPGKLLLGRGQRVYVTLETDAEGYARLGDALLERPDEGVYLKATVWYISKNQVHIRLPFDRFYMNEEDAPQAERAYWRHSGREERDAHIAVRLRSGFGVIEDLYIAGSPILEFLKKDEPTE